MNLTKTNYNHLCVLGFIILSLSALCQSITTVAAQLNGVEACENRCFDKSECSEIGNGLCCTWDYRDKQCKSSIGQDVCHGTSIMSLPPLQQSGVSCRQYSIQLVPTPQKFTVRTLDGIGTLSAPSQSPTKYDKRSQTYYCENIKVRLDLNWYLCKGFTISEVITLIVSAKVTATLSIIGSSYVVQDVLRDPVKRNKSTFHRIMLGLSISDIIYSFFGPFLGSWSMPKGFMLYAAGNDTTCTATGFFIHSAWLSTTLYNCSLATYYFLILKPACDHSRIKAVEKWLLILPCVVPLISSISAVAMDVIRPLGLNCSPYYYSPIHTAIALMIRLCSICYITITMSLVYRNVRKIEKEALKYSIAWFKSKAAMKLKMSRRIMVQGILYSSVLGITVIVIVVTASLPGLDSSFTNDLIFVLLFPAQGLFNALIYIIPQIRQMRKKKRKAQQQIKQLLTNDKTAKKDQKVMFNESPTSEQDEEMKEEIQREESNDRIGSSTLVLADDEELMFSAVSNTNKIGSDTMVSNDDEEPMFSAVSQYSNLKTSVEEVSTVKEIQHVNSSIKSSLSLDLSKILEDLNFMSLNDHQESDSDDDSYGDDYLKLMEN